MEPRGVPDSVPSSMHVCASFLPLLEAQERCYSLPSPLLTKRFPWFQLQPQAVFYNKLLSTLVWNVCSSTPDEKLVAGIRQEYDACCLSWCSKAVKRHDKHHRVMLTWLSCCLSIMENRVLALRGLRPKRQVHKRMKAYPAGIQRIVLREPEITDLKETEVFVEFVVLQHDAVTGHKTTSSKSHLYQLQHGQNTYIGQSIAVSVSKNLKQHFPDRDVIASETIRRVVKNYLNFKIYRLGDVFVQQLQGVPIGGFLSTSIQGMTFGADEHRFDCGGWSKFADKHGLQGPRHRWVSASRYEDDLLMLSHKLCCACLETLPSKVYKCDANFSADNKNFVAKHSQASNKFLDMRTTITSDGLQFDVFHGNLKIAETGDYDSISKNKYPHSTGARSMMVKRLSANFMTRRARWAQIGIEPIKVVEAVHIECLELLRIGYPIQTIRRAWYASAAHDPYYIVGLAVTKSASFARTQTGPRWHMDVHTLAALQSFFGIDAATYPWKAYHRQPYSSTVACQRTP